MRNRYFVFTLILSLNLTVINTSGQSNDIGISESYFDIQNTQPDFTDSLSRLFYTKVPQNQANNLQLHFGVKAINYGANSAAGASVHVSVSGAAGYSDSSSATTINPGDSAFLRITNSTFTPSVVGTYNVQMKLQMDSVDMTPANDSLTGGVPGVSTFDVTDTVWARDNEQVGGSFYFGPGFFYKVGNVFTLNIKDTVTSISCHIAANNAVNIVIALHIWDDPFNTAPNSLAASNYYAITSNDLGNWVTLPFATGSALDNNNDAVLNPGTYLVGVETFDDPTYISKGQTSGVAEGVVLSDPNNYGMWYYVTSGVPKIRMNLGSRYHQLGMDEDAANEQVQVFPNPSTGIVYIRGEGHIKVSDMPGNILFTETVKNSIDLSAYPDGVYFISVGAHVEKLVLKH